MVRIARFTTGDDPRFGLVTGDVDDHGIPDEDSLITALVGDPLYVGLQPTDEQVRLADARLLSPVLPRSKVVGIGRNYAAHAAELGHDLPEEPLMFLKPNTSVVGPGDPVFYPRQTEELHYEGELAVVISRICRDVPKEKWADVVHGFTIGNDVTARDLQRKDGQFTRAKGFDSFCPLGPWVETELDVSDLRVQTFLNGDVKQDGRTSDLIFDVPTLIAHVTSVMTLLPGDVILTGTPEGVGPMEAGDEVEVVVQGIGSLTNKVVRR
ncbi:2-keto-4-pentenoate hydratase/2-oxohepta-3-ene-1,7-dioic acid hydratase in catechol pathway [Nocardioides aurantiacus]|uniref:2-keto-4-pentenoate hydratase/2-oxohepta-3-ene-1,7-dioic acid hydratase in catechol pathway n=1 Tax=Nocardioides aurantiacus TaxID=86796 RepID=A0A3N2CXH6_9ACTN|nr:2-keto-4-pentenoate hydratase/2-oxohepta-3-ene-1,7-dioic acid hydratase in catechol pathway [Nocardioides aurantiacus]